MDDFERTLQQVDLAQLHEEMKARFTDPLRRKHKFYVGPDGISSKTYCKNHQQIIRAIIRQMLSPSRFVYPDGTPRTPTRFVFTPFQQFEVPKKPGSKELRPLSKGSIISVFAQKILARFMSPILEKYFFEHSYAYRPNKSAKKAVLEVQKAIKDGYLHVLDADISKYFDSVDHDILLGKVNKIYSNSPKFTHMIYRFIKTGHVKISISNGKRTGKIRSPICKNENNEVIKGSYHPREKGIPQGGILSGLLANLYLNDFDHEIINQFPTVRLIRYADDFLIFCSTKEELNTVHVFVAQYLMQHLKLGLHPVKTNHRQIAPQQADKAEPYVDFLGYRICQGKVKIQPHNIRAFKTKMKSLILEWRNSNRLVGVLIQKVKTRLQGRLYEFGAYSGSTMAGRNWTAYFSLLSNHLQLKELDDWLASEMLKAIRYRGISNHTRETLRKRGLPTIVGLHYKMEKARRLQRQEYRSRQLQLTDLNSSSQSLKTAL